MENVSPLWAWVTIDPSGKVGMVGALIAGTHTPLCHRDRAFMEKLRPFAQSHARASGQKVWLREFTAVVDHEEA